MTRTTTDKPATSRRFAAFPASKTREPKLIRADFVLHLLTYAKVLMIEAQYNLGSTAQSWRPKLLLDR